MSKIPVICDSCNALFVANNIISGNARKITLMGNTVGPCPSCGGTGHIPDGVYDLIDDTLKFLHGSAKSIAEIERFQQFLEQVRTSSATAQEIVGDMQSHFPDFAPIMNFIVPISKEEILAYIQILLAIILYFLSQSTHVDVTIQDQRIFNNITVVNNYPPNFSSGADGPIDDTGKQREPRRKP